MPPAIRIPPAYGPDAMTTAVCLVRRERIGGPDTNRLVAGSYSSVEDSASSKDRWPPAIRILPAFGPPEMAVAV